MIVVNRSSCVRRSLGEPAQAESYLVDFASGFEKDGWSLLHVNALKQLANCYKAAGDSDKYGPIHQLLHYIT